jgi:23S rRNA pseudouridine1911/1915/1917 synthase
MDAASPPTDPAASQRVILTVASSDAGERLDRYLARQLPDRSRSSIQKWIGAGCVWLDGALARASARLAAGQTIRIDMPPEPRMETLAQRIPLAVLYEDDYMAVIDKPAGMVVHPAAGHWDGTLVNALMARYPDLAEAGPADDEESAPSSDALPRPGIVHRLDKDTSGLILVAKSPRVAELLQTQFQARQIHKTYLALVHGVPSAPAGAIDAPIGRDPRQRKRMAVLPAGRPALTRYRLATAYRQFALLEVQPQTGRTHQIRVHLAFIGHPVVGDELYGRRKHPLPCQRQFLHAWRITFDHPISSASMTFEAPLPADLVATLDAIVRHEY